MQISAALKVPEVALEPSAGKLQSSLTCFSDVRLSPPPSTAHRFEISTIEPWTLSKFAAQTVNAQSLSATFAEAAAELPGVALLPGYEYLEKGGAFITCTERR